MKGKSKSKPSLTMYVKNMEEKLKKKKKKKKQPITIKKK